VATTGLILPLLYLLDVLRLPAACRRRQTNPQRTVQDSCRPTTPLATAGRAATRPSSLGTTALRPAPVKSCAAGP